jgi:hypothetical protein
VKHKCPKCGHEWEAPSANQTKGGKARWKGTKKKDRSSAARAAAVARWKNNKASPGPSNIADQRRSPE